MRTWHLARFGNKHRRFHHRGVPNVFLSGNLMSDGPGNASQFKNDECDALAKNYITMLDLEVQRAVAGKIQRLLLQETPMISPTTSP